MTTLHQSNKSSDYLFLTKCFVLLSHFFDFLGSQCDGSCGQGQGDCDNDGECLDGLWCEFDGWWGDDYCRAGNFILSFHTTLSFSF